MRYRVVFTPEAEEQLADLYRYIAFKAAPAIAESTPAPSSPIAKAWTAFRIAGRDATTFVRGCASQITSAGP